jgi:hypothetical protein
MFKLVKIDIRHYTSWTCIVLYIYIYIYTSVPGKESERKILRFCSSHIIHKYYVFWLFCHLQGAYLLPVKRFRALRRFCNSHIIHKYYVFWPLAIYRVLTPGEKIPGIEAVLQGPGTRLLGPGGIRGDAKVRKVNKPIFNTFFQLE